MIHHRLCSLKAFRSIFPEALTPIRANKSASFRFIHASYVAAPGFLQESGDGRTDARTHLLGIASTIKHPPVILLYGDTYSICQHIPTSVTSSSYPPSDHVKRETPRTSGDRTNLLVHPTHNVLLNPRLSPPHLLLFLISLLNNPSTRNNKRSGHLGDPILCFDSDDAGVGYVWVGEKEAFQFRWSDCFFLS